MLPRPRRFLSCLAAAVSLLAVCDASAVVLGEIRSSSRLGELLHAEIDVEEEPADRFDASCVKLYQPAQASGDLPWITEARLSFRRENGKGKLYISADRPLRDPVVQIGVQSTCPGGRVWRDYTFLVSPVAFAPRETSAAAVISPSAKTAAPPKNMDRVSLSQHTVTAAKAVVNEPARHLDAEIARPARKVRGISSDRLVSADSEPVLRMAPELRASGVPSEAERDLLRLEYRLLTRLHDQTDSQLALAERLRRLERDASQLKAAGERLALAAAVVPPPVSEPLPPSAPALLPASVSVAAPVVEKGEPVVAPPAVIESSPRVIPQAPPEILVPEASDDWFDWALYAGPGALLLVGVLLLMRRRRAAAMNAHFLPLHAPTIVLDEPGFSQTPEKVAPAPFAAAGEAAGEAPEPVAVAPVVHNIPPPEELEVNPVMELAEIMLSFGRVQGAAQTLQEYIQAHPKEALQPWIRLLEIYRGNGLRTEFEKLAENLNQNFNVEIVHWDDAMPGERVEMTLELLPHVRDQIDALWGKPECLEYLQKLLHDNRDGQRMGFALPVVKEILSLIDLMVAEKAAAR